MVKPRLVGPARLITPSEAASVARQEICRPANVVGIFPGCGAIIRLVGTVLAQQRDERNEARGGIGPEVLTACRRSREANEVGGI